ncbi:CHAD domain-containing protein [Stieleria sp. TO1_6]|nr:CHAD domain-containing protein [Stieleria tagensis]
MAAGNHPGVRDVHQLRVSVRRAEAALKLYADLLPTKRTRLIRKQLRTLRRAAGQARDLDVVSLQLAELDSEQPRKALAKLRKQVAAKRIKAQRPLKRSYLDAKKDGFVKRSAQLIKRIRWRGTGDEPSFQDFAHRSLDSVVNRFFAAGQADLAEIDALHEMRIQGKGVRYGMELLAPAFAKRFRKELYPVFAKAQERLGKVNDHASAIEFYRSQFADDDNRNVGKLIQELLQKEHAELEAKHRAVLDWWTPERADELRAQFTTVLTVSVAESDVVNESLATDSDEISTPLL